MQFRFITLLFFIFLGGCSFQKDKTPDVEPTFTSINAAVFQPKCNTCHDGSRRDVHGIRLSSYTDLFTSNNSMPKGFIVPGKPEESALYLSIATDNPPNHIERMPPKPRARLSAKEIKAVYYWILNGAMESDSPLAPPAPKPIEKPIEEPEFP